MKTFSTHATGSITAQIQAFDTNPGTPAISDGSIWVNRSGSINFAHFSQSIASAAWSDGGQLPGGRSDGAGGGSVCF